MTTVIKFSWFRFEGLGLITVALGLGLFVQLPVTYFAFMLLFLNLDQYFIALSGTIIGVSVILATLSCSISEDWNESDIPTMQKVVTWSTLFSFIYLIGFFLFFILETSLSLEYRNLEPAQRYFSAITLAMILIGISSIIIYKTKNFFNES
ncbi:MAG: hypothetical protein ACXACR_11660 [Candidatus Hodarchaeales archaeon]|jgi:uncharacterized membrane protein YjfL (UPF0719 family)